MPEYYDYHVDFDDEPDWMVEDREARENRPLAADWCPTCGESEAEHTVEGLDRCVNAYYASEMAISYMLNQTAAKAIDNMPPPVKTRFEREPPV